MKKILCLFSVLVAIILSGCLEVTQETTINGDGSGVFTNTTDMSAVIGMMKMMGGDESKELENMKVDTSIQLISLKDSLESLSDAENILLNNAVLNLKMNVPDEEFMLKFQFPYSKPEDVSTINSILKKTKKKILGDQMNKIMPGDEGTDDMGNADMQSDSTDIDDYFDISYTKGKLTKKLNKDRYANAPDDKGLKTMQEMSQLGSPMKMITIFNLPKPATKAEGKGIKLSNDKKKVTIETTIDDFFESPEKFEYVIEY